MKKTRQGRRIMTRTRTRKKKTVKTKMRGSKNE